MQAIGLIEVIGYPPAIEAADAALKAANVTLLCIAKADAGIMTVELTGEVGAVTSAVDAGAEAAKRVGTLRAQHVIPRVDQELLGTIIGSKKTLEKSVEAPQVPKTPEVLPEEEFSKGEPVQPASINLETDEMDKIKEINKTEEINKTVETDKTDKAEMTVEKLPEYSQAELSKLSNQALKSISTKLGVDFSDNPSGANRKQVLIEKILEHQKKRKEGDS